MRPVSTNPQFIKQPFVGVWVVVAIKNSTTAVVAITAPRRSRFFLIRLPLLIPAPSHSMYILNSHSPDDS